MNTVVIRIRMRSQRCRLLLYDLQKNEELSSLEVAKDAMLFFSSDGKYMVFEDKVGIIDLESGQVLKEYQLCRHVFSMMDNVSLKQGQRLLQTQLAKYFVLPNLVVMPYSLISVAMHN